MASGGDGSGFAGRKLLEGGSARETGRLARARCGEEEGKEGYGHRQVGSDYQKRELRK
jgi:hypothetical protein